MAYQAIYRKWRPLSFEDVVGQPHIVGTLKSEVKSGRIAHAYLFCGTRGTGKTTTAKILSRAVNCLSPLPNGNPCNQCEICKGILSGSIMDVVEIDAASNNGVDNIRELRDEVIYTPASTKYKVYIIDEVHMLSTGAFNALLKTLEEPPAHAIFILATTEPHKVPATIQSRCQRFDFRRISSKHIAGRIGEIARQDGIDITPGAIQLAAQLGDGSMRDALSVLDLCAGIDGQITREIIEDIAGVAGRETVIAISQALIGQDISNAITLLSALVRQGAEINNILESVTAQFRELMICKLVKDSAVILDKSQEEIDALNGIAAKAPAEKLLHAVHVLSQYSLICKNSGNPQVMLESAFVKICMPETDSSSEAFAARIARLESGAPVAKQPENNVPSPPSFDVEPEVIVSDEFAGLEPPPEEKAPPVESLEKKPEPSEMVQETSKYNEILARLSTHNPAVASLLMDTRYVVHNDTSYIVFENEMFRDTIMGNSTFVDAVAEAVGSRSVKFVTQQQLDDTGPEKDPFEELLDKGGGIEQISIY